MLLGRNINDSDSGIAVKFMIFFAMFLILAFLIFVFCCVSDVHQKKTVDKDLNSEEIYIIHDEVVETGYIYKGNNTGL